MYVKRNFETRSRYHFFFAFEKSRVLHILSVSLFSCLSYPTCNAHGPYYIVISGLFGCIMFFSH
jgi:hypothetical protein